MAGPLTWTGFRDLWKSLKDDSARLNFIKHCFVAKEYSKSPGEYLYPGTSVFMQQAVDNLASDMMAQYIEEKREENKRPFTL